MFAWVSRNHTEFRQITSYPTSLLLLIIAWRSVTLMHTTTVVYCTLCTVLWSQSIGPLKREEVREDVVLLADVETHLIKRQIVPLQLVQWSWEHLNMYHIQKRPTDVSTENPLSTKRGDLIKVAVIFGYVQSIHAVNISLLCYPSSCPEVWSGKLNCTRENQVFLFI